jgi:hypothetical protein
MESPLDNYREEIERGLPHLAGSLDALAHELTRSIGPRGAQAIFEGAHALLGLGRGVEAPTAWLKHAPAVARECGADVLADVLEALMKLASLTSGSVIARVCETLPTAASRFGDPELLRGWLRLLHRLASRAPRGLRPMLGVLDELLAKLSLSGLGRWADFGAEAYRRDLAGQAAYFALQTDDSRAVLQAERRGTLLVDNQRRIGLFLRAFWARDFFIRPAAGDGESLRPFIEAGAMHLPDAVDDLPGVAGIELYRAMAAHMAAHLCYTRHALDPEALAPAQRFLIGMFEDARVEQCAIAEFPGLLKAWRALHGRGQHAEVHPALPILARLALALLDPVERSGDPALDALVDGFRARLSDGAGVDGRASIEAGLALHHLLQQGPGVPSLRALESLDIPYRDDNRAVWRPDCLGAGADAVWLPASARQQRRRVSMMEFVNEIDCETAGEDAEEVWVLDGVLYDDDGTTWNEREGRDQPAEPVLYPEWDYRVQLSRPDWASVVEYRARRGDPQTTERILAEHRPVANRIRHMIDRLRPQGVIRQRKLEDGDELDLNAAVDAVVALRAGLQPDTRFTMRNRIRTRDLAVLILLDLSESTNEKVRGSDKTVLELTREACVLLATAIEGIGDRFAVHGFCSDGRHDVQYRRFKDFDERFGDDARARLAGMQGGLSTRMGAAMRHAGRLLLRQSARHRLLLVVTDGEPADIDERDPQALRADARKAVEGLHAQGIESFCLSLDPEADRYVQRIFGGRHVVVDHVQRLPERLPGLFASLTA